jgi:hypothetical protein
MINPQKVFSSFVPEPYKPLLACISPSAFRVVKWQDVLAEAPLLAKKMTTGDGVINLAKDLERLLPKDIEIFAEHRSQFSNSLSLRAEDGFTILELYFAQFKNDNGIFLDLRQSNFSLSSSLKVQWRLNGLWTKFRPEFRKGMLSIYKGYYFENSALLRDGLKQVGLIKEHFSESLISNVEEMILNHIGGETTNQQFKVLHFTKGFENLFQFLLKEKIVLSSDFLYLGVYLASLYLHLERLGGEYNVRQAFFNNFQEMDS